MRNKRYSYPINLLLKGIFICIFILPSQFTIGQDECLCNDMDKITICYYSANQVCPPGDECRYTLDGQFMRDALREKLLNPDLFGPEGVSKCSIELEPMGSVNSVEFLETRNCNIVFIGAFSAFLGVGGLGSTDIPTSELETIKEWSSKCPNNLTIVSQIEAQPWGYLSFNLNINPNKPDPVFSNFSIFDGVFGQIDEFDQGGSFQGVFDGFPTTGYSILARDLNNRPTVVLDSLTNDIILGDIGILCTTVGPLSFGDQVLFDNDILACNLFDLGCQIAGNTTTDFVNICEGETHTTPGGQVLSSDGIYIDSFLTVNNCDSLIYTVIDFYESYDILFENSSCDNDDFEIVIGNTLYNKANKTGTEFFSTSEGCDSTISVTLFYAQLDTTYLSESICEGEEFSVGNFLFSETGFTEVILDSNGDCDSIVYLDLITNESYDTLILIDLCVGDVYVASDGTPLSANGAYAEYYFNEYDCDSIITTVVTVNESYDLEEQYFGCKGDGYNLNVGGGLYDESNPSGVEFLRSSKGCDSTITILFEYETVDTTYLEVALCPYESFEVGGVEYSGTLYEEIILPSSVACDSVIYLDLETYTSEGIYLDSLYDINLNEAFSFNLANVEGSSYEWITDGNISCRSCYNPDLLPELLPSNVQLTYADSFNCVYESQAKIQYRCTPFFSNVLKINGQTEKNKYFKVEALCSFDQYTMKIYDRWGSNVFASDDQFESWDGTYNGKSLAQGVYVYVMEYDLRGLPKQIVGSIMVLR